MTTVQFDRTAVADIVKRVVVTESRSSADPADISEREPLMGDRLRVNSLGFVGMLVRIEDELGVALPDDLFVGRSFTTVADLVDVVIEGSAADR
jgi:acyl carrier protein